MPGPTDNPSNNKPPAPPLDLNFTDPWKSPTRNIQHRHLPHLATNEATYFITFRCHKGMNIPEKARREVLNAILHWNGTRIDLDAAVVMPTHVHMIFRLIPENKIESPNNDNINSGIEAAPALGKITHSIKSYTANRINKILGRKGPYWLNENFDRIIRSEADRQEKIRYIIENPVKKQLCDTPESYEWLWTRPDQNQKANTPQPQIPK